MSSIAAGHGGIVLPLGIVALVKIERTNIFRWHNRPVDPDRSDVVAISPTAAIML